MNTDQHRLKKKVSLVLSVFICVHLWFHSTPIVAAEIELTLQSREKSGKVVTAVERVEPSRVAVVLVDTWNFHWCMTATQRCGSFVERFNHATQCARKLGMQVLWCPTDVADMYVGWQQRQDALAVPRVELPASLNIPFKPIECFESNGCMCGPGIKCKYNYGWDGMASKLTLGGMDLIPEGTAELYSVCKARGITHLIYFGFHTNVCTTGKPVGIRAMANAGLKCVLARDMTDGITGYDPASGNHPDGGTLHIIEQVEMQVPTVHFADEMRKLKLWDDAKPVDPVRITPWGTPSRPYMFEQSTVVTLSAPLNGGVQIRYTLDGSEPSISSPLYSGPFKVEQTTTVRAAGFNSGGNPVCLASVASLVKLPPMPAKPGVSLADLKPVHSTSHGFHNFGSDKKARLNTAYSGGALVLREKKYEQGYGVAAPSEIRFKVEPGYTRFVARAGVDEGIIDDDLGRAQAMYPSVVFSVYIDGKRAAQSPVMRMHTEPWRFDVEIPRGSREISLVTTDAGDGSRGDLGDWVEAGFVTRKESP